MFVDRSSGGGSRITGVTSLLHSVGLDPHESVFYDSLPKCKVPGKTGVFSFLERQFLGCSLRVVFMRSPRCCRDPIDLGRVNTT